MAKKGKFVLRMVYGEHFESEDEELIEQRVMVQIQNLLKKFKFCRSIKKQNTKECKDL